MNCSHRVTNERVHANRGCHSRDTHCTRPRRRIGTGDHKFSRHVAWKICVIITDTTIVDNVESYRGECWTRERGGENISMRVHWNSPTSNADFREFFISPVAFDVTFSLLPFTCTVIFQRQAFIICSSRTIIPIAIIRINVSKIWRVILSKRDWIQEYKERKEKWDFNNWKSSKEYLS